MMRPCARGKVSSKEAFVGKKVKELPKGSREYRNAPRTSPEKRLFYPNQKPKKIESSELELEGKGADEHHLGSKEGKKRQLKQIP